MPRSCPGRAQVELQGIKVQREFQLMPNRVSELLKGVRLFWEMSKPQVTITLGRSGQVVKRSGTASDASRSEYVPSSGNKRSIRERLGTLSDNRMLSDGPAKTKRQRDESHRWSLSNDEANDGNQFGSYTQVNRNDLRFKLMQKRYAKQTSSGGELIEMDLRKKLSRTLEPSLRYCDAQQHVVEQKPPSLVRRIPPIRSADDLLQVDSLRKSNSNWTLDGLRRRSPDRFTSSPMGGISPPRSIPDLRNVSSIRPRPVDHSRTAHSFAPKNVVHDSRPASLMTKPVTPIEPLKPVARFAPPSGVVQKTSYPAEEPVTVAGLLHSLDLGKYAILFQAEEVDMTALRQMGDHDLKELGIPMGPRKKILLAVLRRSKHRST
ncbi:hypothetical protein H6P81_010415 [Aristolochia fimbriata]|uniref:SAM domain-containing protein n=1 Tax=Aristolochia fimbriata TaxID=158543 RepID=A0AAV7ENP1_ARIFI|nr:hypothetical protein H6P81_010415 [Aristolochia fimbriata]